MIETESPIKPPGTDLRLLTHVVYALYAIGFLTSGFLAIATVAAIVVMYIKRADTAGTLYSAHFDWLLRTFWWALLWCGIGFILLLIFVGWIVIFATIVWVIYRIARGWLALLDGRAPTQYG